MRFLCFRLLIISVLTVLVIGSSTNGNEETSLSVKNDMEGEDGIINKLPEDYRSTFSHVHGFMDSLIVVMEQLNRRMESLETQLRQSSENMNAMNASMNAIQLQLQQSSENRNTTDASLLTATQRLETVVTSGCLSKDQNNITVFDYNRHARLKPTPSTGKSFSGSTLAEISNRIPTPSTYLESVTVEFANRLDSTIDYFQIRQAGENAVKLPSEHIPGNTKEAFTFRTGGGHYPHVAFSYLIPDPTLRIAVYAGSGGLTRRAVGLAFLPSTVPISTYYDDPGSFGEHVKWTSSPTGSEKTILAKKNGFIAKAILKDAEKAIVRVELMEVALC